jgi:hypothetical protein
MISSLLLIFVINAHAEPAVFRPGQPMFDTAGNQIDAHGGGFLLDNRTWYWYGSARKDHPDPPGNDKGINLYSSNDLYNWKFESLVVSALKLQNGSSLRESTKLRENGLDLERPKVVRCKAGHYVMWLRGTPVLNGTDLKVGVLTASSPLGPWKWVIQADSTPFHLLGDRYQFGDHTLWSDEETGKAYVYWRARTPQAGFRGMMLNDACTDVVQETDTHIFNSPNREAPAFFSTASGYYLWASGTMGWAPIQAYVYKGPSPLGPFNSSIGHGWHAYYKPAEFNTTHKYTVRDGYLPSGVRVCVYPQYYFTHVLRVRVYLQSLP